MMAKFCSNCGNELPENAGMCVKCGVMINDNGSQKNKKKGFPVWAIVLIVVFCIIILPIVILVILAILGFNYIEKSDINIEDYINDVVSVRGTIGDSLTDGDIKITLTSIEKYDEIELDGVSSKPTEGYEYLVLFFDVQNISDEVLYVSTYNFSGKVDFNIIDSKVFDGTINNNKMLGSNIKSGDGTTGFVLYEVPTGWKNFTIQYKENSFDRESITFDIANDDSNSEV